MIECSINNLYHNDRKFYHHDRILMDFLAIFCKPKSPCDSFLPARQNGAKKKCKAKAKAGAEPSAKKQKTKAAAAEDELQLVQWQPHGAMSAVLFHKKATKMRNLLLYRSSEDCKKAYIYMYTYHVSS